jgi:uncharacterized iron-regulated membrane protein
MKLPRRVFVAWWHVHAWTGVLAALVLAAMFLGGTLSVFRQQIMVWQDPPATEIDRAATDRAVADALADRKVAGGAVGLSVPRSSSLRPVLWLARGDDTFEEVHVAPDRKEAGPPTSRLMDVFYHLHFMWHEDVPILMVIAGVFGVLFLLAVVTGVAIHLKDIDRQMYRFRPQAAPRTVWSDVHKILGVWGLLFQLMIAMTGALICFLGLLSPHIGLAVYSGDREAATASVSSAEAAPPTRSGRPAPSLGLGTLATAAERALPGMKATYVSVEPWGDAAAVATVYGMRDGDGLYPEVAVRLRARDGAVLGIPRPEDDPIAHRITHAVYGLHFAVYGGIGLRILYVLLGLAGWVTILTGNWIWIERRRARGHTRGPEILARLTVGIGGGMLVAAAALFWINRLAAVDADRPALEAYGFFTVWGVVALVCALVTAGTRTWAILGTVAGGALMLLPAVSVIAGPTYAGAAGRTAALVDLTLALVGAALLVAARVLRRRSRTVTV